MCFIFSNPLVAETFQSVLVSALLEPGQNSARIDGSYFSISCSAVGVPFGIGVCIDHVFHSYLV
ncbi:hypothetical protein A3194_15325 [Candidatus Thiodiazotropha endoloripes]|nr:hypothetical protein A3194_15325 [Candidatus Thiodiazotropha endoloripes]ODB88864.1 hypothetical protein A3193_08580 [Candidatus Thiodiazotropha endoloripes]